MHLYVVGKPYHPMKKVWPEATQYNYRGGDHELILFFNRPKQGEIAGVESGRAKFGVLYEDGVVSLLYTIDGVCGWSDSPYNWWFIPEEERAIPMQPEEHSEESRALLHILLVGAHNGLLLAMRAISLPPEVTRALHGAIRDQAGKPFVGDAEYGAAIARLQARYPNPAMMAAKGVTGEGGI